MAATASKRLEWSRRAAEAYVSTLATIADQDPATANSIRQRVTRALALIQSHPSLGTPTPRRGERRFAVPRTGHILVYRITRNSIRIQLWYRARRHVR